MLGEYGYEFNVSESNSDREIGKKTTPGNLKRVKERRKMAENG